LPKEQHIKRHDSVCAQIHLTIFKEIWVKLYNEHWHEHVPKLVEISHEGAINVLWNQQVQTNRMIRNNMSDIIMHDNEK
jgi:hypothetical protein